LLASYQDETDQHTDDTNLPDMKTCSSKFRQSIAAKVSSNSSSSLVNPLQNSVPKPSDQDVAFLRLFKKSSKFQNNSQTESAKKFFPETNDCLKSSNGSTHLPKEPQKKRNVSLPQKFSESSQKTTYRVPTALQKIGSSTNTSRNETKMLSNPSSSPLNTLAKDSVSSVTYNARNLSENSPPSVQLQWSSSLSTMVLAKDALSKEIGSSESLKGSQHFPKGIHATQNTSSSQKPISSGFSQLSTNQKKSTNQTHVLIPSTEQDLLKTSQRLNSIPDLVKTDSLSSTVDEDIEIVTGSEITQEIVYTDAQIKLLKKAIKKFFNKLDLDTFDPSKHRVKGKFLHTSMKDVRTKSRKIDFPPACPQNIHTGSNSFVHADTP